MFLLVLIAVLPALGIQAYNEYDLRAARSQDIRQQVIQITKQFGEEMGELREGARQLLVALGQLSSVKFQESDKCNSLFSSTKANFNNYNLLGAADAQGHIFCSSDALSYSLGHCRLDLIVGPGRNAAGVRGRKIGGQHHVVFEFEVNPTGPDFR